MAVLQGKLDMFILRMIPYGPAHGHRVVQHIQRTTNELLQWQHGSLYSPRHRLEQRGGVIFKWDTGPVRNRESKYYRLAESRRKELVVEDSPRKQMAEAVARVMWPAIVESEDV
ncbi:MAG TPA: helix-turn-helix transcriptional regulator [Terracidiphilus sp.]|jgi:PadR family transcriptional regulator, regulatory protein PadR